MSLLGEVGWARGSANVWYWGDLDTHGFSILALARRTLPHARSLLMDEATLLLHRQFWVEETTPSPKSELPKLTPAESDVFAGLRAHRWGTRVRLEQERIGWSCALERVYPIAA